jgi:hypothetical protein
MLPGIRSTFPLYNEVLANHHRKSPQRWTELRLYLKYGVPEELRMALTGHKERAVHQRYTHRELQQLRGAIEMLPQVGA